MTMRSALIGFTCLLLAGPISGQALKKVLNLTDGNADPQLFLEELDTGCADNGIIRAVSGSWGCTPIPNCPDASGGSLNYDAATNSLTCGTDAGAGGGMTSFDLRGDDGGTASTITDAEVVDILGGLGLVTDDNDNAADADLTVSFDYSLTLAGDPGLGLEECIFTTDGAGGGGVLCEGSVADGSEGLFLFPDVTGADDTQTLVTDSTAFAGDVTGEIGATVVGDDSHAHTSTTISALDAADTTTGTFDAARLPAATETAQGAVELATSAETTAGLAVQASDTRLSDNRTPTAHAASHESGGADEVALAAAQITTGQLAAARGGTGLDSSGSTGVPRISTGTWTADAGLSHLAASTSADLRGVLSDESGTGAAVFAGGAIGAATATTPAADDSSTSVATTAYVQGELNGSGGRSLTATSGVLDADAELYTDTKCMVIESPDDADDLLFFRTDSAITVTGIDCLVDAATSAVVTVQECDANGGSCVAVEAAMTCGTTNTADDGIDNAAVDAGDWLRVDIGTVSGTPGHVNVCTTFTLDD